MSITGRSRFRASSAVSAPVREATSASIGRPSGVRPNSTQRTASGQARAYAAQRRSTSS
jgi:hypothetical protein